ncbi:hypothetical protein LTR37_019167 [Vermiconidia calcicola]|uniref:Uncharacterized protein n=1 Tax=Vermiconidia calcicola TaxID=1690605 RepID=A0ACC3MGS7_9PEZI|nr:hypothetical protein LTR37_019167 [Vermiconidia calcicola]
MNVSTLGNGDLAYTAPDGQLYVWGGDVVNCTLPACPVELSIYGYRANLPFSSVLIALYALCAVAQIYLGWRHKTWSFMAAMLLGCFTEILGFVGRILMWQNPWNDTGFTMQIVLITFGPVFFSAAIYVMLSQIVQYISPKVSRVPPKVYYYTFIPCDIIALILQAVGGAMSSTSNGASDVGVNIALAGLAFQVITLVAFSTACADYMILSRRVWQAAALPTRFKVFCAFFTLATLLILIRCSYRVYELSEGYTSESEALRDQPLFIGLEGVMVVLAAWCLVAAHPSALFKRHEGSLAEKQTIQDPVSHETEV